MKIPRKCHNYEAQHSRGTKGRRDEEQIKTTQTPCMKPKTTHKEIKEELQQRNCLRTVRRKTAGEVGGMGLKLVLLAGNIILNSAAAPNYKYMFSPHRGPQHCILLVGLIIRIPMI